MDYFSFIIGFLIAAAGGATYTIYAPGGAKNRAKSIIDNAQQQADNRLKEADVSARQLELEKKQQLEEELKLNRDAIHQRERELDKAGTTFPNGKGFV